MSRIDEDGMTGLDVGKAISSLDNFNGACDSTLNNLKNAFDNLFAELAKNWASPDAFAFTERQIPNVNTQLTAFLRRKNDILTKANAAASALANANGSYMPMKYTGGENAECGVSAPGCKENINGTVGMAKEQVKLILGQFVSDIKKAISSFSGIPTGMAFYDPAGHLLGSYSRGVNDFISVFSSLFTDIEKDLEHLIDEEVHDITIAKEQAQSTLSA